ncbi:MAG: hypothetical protein U0872_08655 [Planctomycetaceae bacterium]
MAVANLLGVNLSSEWEACLLPPTFLLAIALPCVTSLSLAWLLSRVIERGGDHPGLAYTWKAIVARPEISAQVKS